jgi:hypothetical protein
VSQVLSGENSLVDFQTGSRGLTDFNIYRPFLAAHMVDRAAFLSALHAASTTAPTPALRGTLGSLATKLKSSVSFGGETDTLDMLAQNGSEGLTPLYQELGRQCPSSLSSTKPTYHQQAESSALLVVRVAALTQAARGHAAGQDQVQHAIDLSGADGGGTRTIKLVEQLGPQVTKPVMWFRVTNEGGSWPVCVRVPSSPLDPIDQVKVVNCTLPAGNTTTGA